MKQIIIALALILSAGVPSFAGIKEPVKPNWVQMWTADGKITLHNDGDPCTMVSIIEYSNGSFDYTVMNLCGPNDPPYLKTFEYFV